MVRNRKGFRWHGHQQHNRGLRSGKAAQTYKTHQEMVDAFLKAKGQKGDPQKKPLKDYVVYMVGPSEYVVCQISPSAKQEEIENKIIEHENDRKKYRYPRELMRGDFNYIVAKQQRSRKEAVMVAKGQNLEYRNAFGSNGGPKLTR